MRRLRFHLCNKPCKILPYLPVTGRGLVGATFCATWSPFWHAKRLPGPLWKHLFEKLAKMGSEVASGLAVSGLFLERSGGLKSLEDLCFF